MSFIVQVVRNIGGLLLRIFPKLLGFRGSRKGELESVDVGGNR